MLGFVAVVDKGEVFAFGEAGVEELFELLGADFGGFGEVGGEDDAFEGDGQFGEVVDLGGAEAGGDFREEDGGHASGGFGKFGGEFEAVGEGAVGGDGGGVLGGEAVVDGEAGASGFGEFGHGGEDVALPGFAYDQRREIGFGEVAVVVSLLFAAHGEGAAFGVVPEAGFLDDSAAVFDDTDLAFDLVLEGGADVAEAINVFYFGLGAELFGAFEHDADIGVAAEGAFFHVAVGDAGVEEDFLEAGEVFEGFIRGAEVGFGDDFNERGAAAVEVNVGAGGGIGEAVVEALAGVFFEMEAGDADGLGVAGSVGDGDASELGQGLVELRDLVALGGVGVEVVLTREDRGFVDSAADGGGGENGLLDGVSVQDGEGAGKAKADGAGVGIGIAAVLVFAAAEVFGGGQELDMNLEANDGLVFCEDVWGEHGGCCGHS